MMQAIGWIFTAVMGGYTLGNFFGYVTYLILRRKIDFDLAFQIAGYVAIFAAIAWCAFVAYYSPYQIEVDK